MTQDERDHKYEDLDKTIVTYGVILRMPLEDIPEFKKHLKEMKDTKVIYQKMTVGWLSIQEESGPVKN